MESDQKLIVCNMFQLGKLEDVHERRGQIIHKHASCLNVKVELVETQDGLEISLMPALSDWPAYVYWHSETNMCNFAYCYDPSEIQINEVIQTLFWAIIQWNVDQDQCFDLILLLTSVILWGFDIPDIYFWTVIDFLLMRIKLSLSSLVL